jgi:hypothetical protein
MKTESRGNDTIRIKKYSKGHNSYKKVKIYGKEI